MLILLPPSEGKTAPADGAPVDLGSLAYPELTAKRERALAALVRVSSGKQRGRALKALGLSAGQAGELDRNAGLEDAPAAPAAEVYTGVLYERLRLPGAAGGRARAGADRERAVGRRAAGRPDPGLPAVDLGAAAADRRPGGLLAAGAREGAARRGARGRPALRRLRRGVGAGHATVVGVRGFTEQDGERKVISHLVKAIRGDVARALLQAPEPARTPEDVAAIAAAPGIEVELTGSSVDVIARA